MAEKLSLLSDAKAVAENIPSMYDRVERLRLLATVTRDIDMVLAWTLVVDAMQVVKKAATATQATLGGNLSTSLTRWTRISLPR